jgi:hypothetical protein
MPQEPKDVLYVCKICMKESDGKTGLIEHLRTDHESLEVVSFAATTMVQEQERDKSAMEFHRQFEQIKKELTAG